MATEINKPFSPTVRTAAPVPKARTEEAAANNSPAANNSAPAENDAEVTTTSAPAANNASATTNSADQAEKKESKNQVMGFFEGFTREAVDTAVGFYNLVTTNPITTAKGVVYMATHPRLAVQAITEPYTTAWKDGRYGELAGRASFQVLTILLTTGALSKSGKGAEVGSKAAKPTEAAVKAAQQVTSDMAQDLAKRTAMRKVEEMGLTGTAKAAAVRKLTGEYTAKFSEKIATRGLADKIAQGIASSGVTDDALARVMSASGGKIPANKVYQFASAATKAGLKPEAIAGQLSTFGTMSAKKAASEFPLALKLMQSEARTAAVIAAGATPSAANAIAQELKRLEKLAGGAGDDALKAGYQAQLDALKQSLANSPRTQGMVSDILAGKNVGPAERRMAEIGQSVDNAGKAVSNATKGVKDGGQAVKKFLDGPKTIGEYADAISAVPKAIGRGIDTAYQSTLDVLKKGIAMIPEFKFKLPNIRAIRVPSPWEMITAPVTVPLYTAKWALTHPGRALGLAGTLGNIGNAGKIGNELASRVEDPTETPETGHREYELKEGDTLESIAERELGDPNRWEEIYDLNRELFDSLGQDGTIAAGTKIKLPAASGETPASDAPADAERYKADLLELIDAKVAEETDADTKGVLTELRSRIAGMDAAEVLQLKDQLEAQGLVVPTAPSSNAPSNNAPANNAPANNAPANNAPATPSKPGTTTPTPSTPPTTTPGTPGPKTVEYTVKRNDTLTEIAMRELGAWRRWPEIVELNKGKYPSLVTNPDFLAIGWKLDLPVKSAVPATKPAQTTPAPSTKPATTPASKPTTPASNNAAKPATNNSPTEPTANQRAEVVKQFNLENNDGNWTKFWQEVSAYPQTTVGPDTGTDAERKSLQTMLGKLGFPVKVTGSYYELGADGQPKTNAQGLPESPTAEAVIAFKKMAGITQGYNVIGADGKATPDVNEYVDARTRETMNMSLRILQDATLRSPKTMEAAVKEAARLQASSIGPEVGSAEARVLVQQYLSGLGYQVNTNGSFDQATIDAVLDFKRKNNLAAPFKNDRGQPVFLPYVDGPTAEALYEAALKSAEKTKG